MLLCYLRNLRLVLSAASIAAVSCLSCGMRKVSIEVHPTQAACNRLMVISKELVDVTTSRLPCHFLNN